MRKSNTTKAQLVKGTLLCTLLTVILGYSGSAQAIVIGDNDSTVNPETTVPSEPTAEPNLCDDVIVGGFGDTKNSLLRIEEAIENLNEIVVALPPAPSDPAVCPPADDGDEITFDDLEELEADYRRAVKGGTGGAKVLHRLILDLERTKASLN